MAGDRLPPDDFSCYRPVSHGSPQVEQLLQSAAELPPVSFGLKARTLQTVAQMHADRRPPFRLRLVAAACLAVFFCVGGGIYLAAGVMRSSVPFLTDLDPESDAARRTFFELANRSEWGLVEGSVAAQRIRIRKLQPKDD